MSKKASNGFSMVFPGDITSFVSTARIVIFNKIMQLDEKAVEKLEASLNEILGEVSIEQYNRELDEADSAIDRGEYVGKTMNMHWKIRLPENICGSLVVHRNWKTTF